MHQARDDTSKVIDWRIPRPSLLTSNGTNSTTTTSNYERNIRTIYTLEMAPAEKVEKVYAVGLDLPQERNWFSSGSSSSSNSSSSSQSDSSGALLLTQHTLNSLSHDIVSVKPADTQSIASSTHFTLVNGVTSNRKHRYTCWRRHQLSIVVVSMTIVLFFCILGAVLFVELRAMGLGYS